MSMRLSFEVAMSRGAEMDASWSRAVLSGASDAAAGATVAKRNSAIVLLTV